MKSNEVNSMNLARWAELARAADCVIEVMPEGLCVRLLGEGSHLVSYLELDRMYNPGHIMKMIIERVSKRRW